MVQHEKAICFVGKMYVRPEKRNIGDSYCRLFPQSAKTHFLLLIAILLLSSNSCTLLVLFLFLGQVHLMPPAKACFFHDCTQTYSSIKQAPRNKSHPIGYGQGKELKFISIVLARKAETFYNVPEIMYLEGICGMFWSFFSYLEIISVCLLK